MRLAETPEARQRAGRRAALVAEMRRVASDWRYACERHYEVENRDPAIKAPTTKLKWNPGQALLAGKILEQEKAGKPIRICLLKVRQFGGSTLIQSYVLHKLMTQRAIPAITVGMDSDNAQHLHSIARGIYRRLPSPLRPMVKYDNKQELHFANPKDNPKNPGLDSHLVCETAGDMARSAVAEGAVSFRRGQMFRYAHLSEVAFWPDPERLLNTLMAAVPLQANTGVFLESTANLRGDAWYRLCKESREGKNEFAFVFIPWFVHPEYRVKPREALGRLSEREKFLQAEHGLDDEQIAWRREKLSSLQFRGDEFAFLREYPEDPESCFSVTGNSMFGGLMPEAEKSRREPVMRVDLFEDKKGEVRWSERSGADLWIFELPKPGAFYAMGADGTEGADKNSDFATAVVLDDRGRVVAAIRTKEQPLTFADTLAKLATFYNNAFLAVERNGAGVALLQVLQLTYPNLYQESKSDGHFGEKTTKLGWRTTEASKTLLINGIRTHLHESEDDACVRDERLIAELGTFVKTATGKREAAPGCHDDMVIAYGIALQALGEVGGKEVQRLGNAQTARGRHMEDVPMALVLGR